MNFISIADFSKEGLISLVRNALEMKKSRKRSEILGGKTLALIFEKPSTRTRVSFEVAMRHLGGGAAYLSSSELQLGRGESLKDTARVLSGYVDGVAMRVYRHESVVEFASSSSVPVINALSDIEHPCQSLGDLMTIVESKGKTKGLRFAWIGDGNNVCNSSILTCALTGMEIAVACPKGYEPDDSIIRRAKKLGGKVSIVNEPKEAAKDADILYTDVWVSMGAEKEAMKREADFRDFQINRKLLEVAKKGAIVMHCLPAHRGKEITDDVLDEKNSVIFQQAENRLHSQKALLVKLMK
jgi:ornithine carbamoyltransferase